MKSQKKLIVIAALIVLLICAAMACAAADEKIYTSPVFRLPADRIIDWAESQPEEPAAETNGEETPEEAVPDEDEDLIGEDEELVGETITEDSGAETPAEPERVVRIYSSQGDVVTEGEIIYLTSKLKGFDGLDIAYQWQVDRGDGAGWVDVEGANRSKHMFVASRETIQYSWRLIVDVIE